MLHVTLEPPGGSEEKNAQSRNAMVVGGTLVVLMLTLIPWMDSLHLAHQTTLPYGMFYKICVRHVNITL